MEPMVSPVIDDIQPHRRSHPYSHLPSPNPAVKVLLAGCAYEIVATGVNGWLGEPSLPLLSNGLKTCTWRTVGRRLMPAWSLPAGLVGIGFVLAVTVIEPRRRRRARNSVRSRALPVPETSRS
jgi:hypothetical protein